jgi:hypothetical protein
MKLTEMQVVEITEVRSLLADIMLMHQYDALPDSRISHKVLSFISQLATLNEVWDITARAHGIGK